MRIRIVTFNLHKNRSCWGFPVEGHHLGQALLKKKVDLALLQEVPGGAKRDVTVPALKAIGFDTCYSPNVIKADRHHGNAVAAKMPLTLEFVKNLDISAHRLEKRGLLWAKVQAPGCQAGNVLCAHLALRAAWRESQWGLLKEVLQEIPEQEWIVLAGDFNAPEKTTRHRLREHGLRLVAEEHEPRPSFPAFLPILELDRIFARGAVVHGHGVWKSTDWAALSDHLPVWADIDLPLLGMNQKME